MAFISVPTITLCIFIVMVAIATAMAVLWQNDRKEMAAAFWALSFSVGAFSGLTVTLMTPGSQTAIVIATTLNTLSYVLSWSGYRAFGKQKVFPSLIIMAPLAHLLVHFLFPALRIEPNNAIVLQSLIVLAVAVLNAHTIFRGEGYRGLSMAPLLVCFLLLHGVFHGVNSVVTYYNPLPLAGGRLESPWLKLFMLEAFLNVVVIATSCLMLIKERSEQRHRVASETDMLTGVANRRAFVQRTEHALRDAHGESVLAVIDLDHFKSINDQFGHQAGDRALVEFARTVKNRLPKDVLFGRIGGEEFAVFIPEAGERSAVTLLNEIRQAVETSAVQSQGRPLPLTVSIGGATLEKAGINFDNLVAAADCALYAAKEEGRNRVTMFSPSMRLLKVLEQDGEKRIGLAEQRVSRRMTRVHNSATTAR